MKDHPTYTGRGLVQVTDRSGYNAEARRIGWPMRVCEFCGLEARDRCQQADGGAAGWYERADAVSCGPCRSTEYVTRRDIRTAKSGLSDLPFGPGEDIR